MTGDGDAPLTQGGPAVYCALDTPDLERAKALAEAIGPSVGGIKLGLEFFCACGPDGIREVTRRAGCPFFLDLKLHDIPNTVAGALMSLAPLEPALVTLHLQGGPEMARRALDAAQEGAQRAGTQPPALLGVTVMTSLDVGDLQAIGVTSAPADQVLRLAEIAYEGGLGGIVCSAHEVQVLRARFPKPFRLVVPGIRPAGAGTGDQKRVMTPGDATRAGADILVIGRPITGAGDPGAAAAAIATEIARAVHSGA